MSEVLEDGQGTVQGVGAADPFGQEGEIAGNHHHGPVLPAAQSAVAADEALEGRGLW